MGHAIEGFQLVAGMRVLLPFQIICVFFSHALGQVVRSEDSPDKRFTVTVELSASKEEFPEIFLVEKATRQKTLLFNFGDLEVRHDNASVSWSPDSKHVAIGTEVEQTASVQVYRIAQHKVSAVRLLPIPAALDKQPPKIRGGPSVDHWQDADTLWIYDNSKHRLFRYHFTPKGSLLADKFEDRDS